MRLCKKAIYFIGILVLSMHSWGQEQSFYNYTGIRTTFSPKDLLGAMSIHNVQQQAVLLYKYKPDSALHLYHLAAEGYEQFHAHIDAGNAYGQISAYYKNIKDFPLSISYLKQSIHQYQRAGLTDSVIWKLLALCNLYVIQGEYQNIKQLYHKMLPLFRSATSPEPLARIDNIMGVIYFQSGSYDSASQFYLKAINEFKSFDSSNYTVYSDARFGLGNIATRLGNYEKAMEYYQAIVLLAEQYKDTLSRTKILVNIGSLYSEQKQYQKAEQISRKVLDIALKNKYYDCATVSAQTIASILIKQGNPEKALPYSKISYQNALQNGSFIYRTNTAYVLGFNYVQLKQYQKAINYLLPALENSKKRGHIDNMINAYNQLATAYEGMRQYRKAYAYKQAYIELKDSLMGKENADRVTRMEIQFRTAEKDKELVRQKFLVSQKENKIREKNIWILATGISGISASLLIFGWFLGRQKLQRKQLEIESLNARMEGEEIERGRIARELHDGVSVLLSAAQMNCTALGNEDRKIEEMPTYREIVSLVDEISIEVRNISYNLVPEMLARQSLPAAIQSFCESISKGHHISIEVQHYGILNNLNAQFTYSVYRIIQELVHNAVKHAEATRILVQLMLVDNTLHLTVEDNGKGFKYDNIEKGMGLQNLKKRITHLKAELSIRSEKDTGTTIEIEILNITDLCQSE